jgi:adenylate cyclase class 2
MSDKEIEIRVRIKDKEPLLKFLEKNGTFKSEKHQRDEYFTPAHRNFIKEKPVKEWLRLREEKGKYSLNYKNWQYTEEDKAYYCDEYEVKIENSDTLKNIFKALNFESLIVVNKERKIFMFDKYEIALDCVEDLGDYVEVEYKGEEDMVDAKKIAEEMKDFIERVGCHIIEQDFIGYPHLLLKKKYDISTE